MSPSAEPEPAPAASEPSLLITQQAGAASSNPSPVKRWLLSRVLTHSVSDAREARQRRRAEARRVRDGRRHVVEYFHQVDDGYSHLAIQTLQRLADTYDIDLRVHLVPEARDENAPEPDLLKAMARRDAADIAGGYGLAFPETTGLPAAGLCELALSVLGAMDARQFAVLGPQVSTCLWRGDGAGLAALAEDHGRVPASAVAERLGAGAARRAKLQHYSGAMFWYGGEWYWGVDRLAHLEARLLALGAVRVANAPMVAPRPEVALSFPDGSMGMRLEFYASLA